MSHDDFLKTISASLYKGARIQGIKIKILKVESEYELVRNGSPVKIIIDIIMILEDVRTDILFIFEAKTGVKRKKAEKQLQFHKSVLEHSRKRLSGVYSLNFDVVHSYYISEEYCKIVHLESGKEVSLFEFLNDPFSFLLA
ncbi:hypothetical protein HY483_00900 [Candidatus Woesearchaeota archaeon]|nr:hypothetical protein [Candidatus Woesearchaeota archaeon]